MSDDHQIDEFRQQALDYHANPIPGKIEIALTKPANSAADLALAYSQVWLSQCVKSRKMLRTCISTPQRAIWWR